MYRRIDKGMKKTIATIAVAVLSFALLAGCGSKTVDPPVKSPDTTSPTTTAAPDPLQEDRVAVAKAVTVFFVNLATESLAFEKINQEPTLKAMDKAFPKTLAAVDLSSFESKTNAYATVSAEGMLLTFLASESPKTSVSDPITVKDVSTIKVTGDKAAFKVTIVPIYKDMRAEDVTFNKVNGKWLLDGKKYTDAYFNDQGFDLSTFPIK